MKEMEPENEWVKNDGEDDEEATEVVGESEMTNSSCEKAGVIH